MDYRYGDGYSKIGIHNCALPTSHVRSTKHEALKNSDKVRQISPRTYSCPHGIANQGCQADQQGRSSCKSLENLSHPSSIISPKPSTSDILASHEPNDTTKVYSQVFCPRQNKHAK